MCIWAQLSASIEEVFHSLDADGNGSLDLEELKAGFAAMVSSSHSHHPTPCTPFVVSPLFALFSLFLQT
jgi:hypothetical protein